MGITKRLNSGNREEREAEEKKEEEQLTEEMESPKSRPAPETQSLPIPYLRVLSGADPELGAALCEAAANGKNWVFFLFYHPIGLSYPGIISVPSSSGALALWTRQRKGFDLVLCMEYTEALAGWVGCPCLPFVGQQVLLINMELGLECQELQWLLAREKLAVQPGFCLYLSTTLPLSALGKGEPPPPLHPRVSF